MESLKELAIMEVLKLGDWQQENIPPTIKNDLLAHENYIYNWMSGFSYYDVQAIQSLCLDVFWQNGIWSFVLHAGRDDKIPILLTEIKSKKITFLSYLWAQTFGLSNTYASKTGFYVKDFDISIGENIVTFYGYYANSCGFTHYFATEYYFFNQSECIRARSVGWKYHNISSYVLMEQFFHQVIEGST